MLADLCRGLAHTFVLSNGLQRMSVGVITHPPRHAEPFHLVLVKLKEASRLAISVDADPVSRTAGLALLA